ncbi:FAD-dependent monooxygenase [Paracidovorax oryzae]|uniref:FAD-dependent monooxygenase n=1 Tax=Paracidovorax oryzae TaxID=862720 RepID=UPI00031070B3|nr:FAD-dependent monooxygenase [Paracidovorax oryzae]
MDAAPDGPVVTEVLIVGAGPTGMALRLALDRLGVASLLVDRHAAGLNTSRAAVIHARTLEVLEPLGVVPDLVAAGMQATDFRVREAGKVLLHIGFQGLPSRYPYALMCPQNITEAILAGRIGGGRGSVWRPARLLSFTETSDRISAALARPDGSVQHVQARWIVGCDGADSVVRQQAGIDFVGGNYAETFVLADVRMAWPLQRTEVSLFFAPEGLMVVAPLPAPQGEPGDRYRMVAAVAGPASPPTQDMVEALLAARGVPSPGRRVQEMPWSSSFQLQHRVAAQVRRGRVLLCGDAAHVHSPAGGQGMNTGIQDAVALAGPLRQALRDDDTRGLDAWARHRHRIARGVVRMTDAMTRIATVSSPLGRMARGSLFGLMGRVPSLQRKLARRLAELDR